MWHSMVDPKEGAILVGAVPAEGAIRVEATVAPEAMIGLGTGSAEKIEVRTQIQRRDAATLRVSGAMG